MLTASGALLLPTGGAAAATSDDAPIPTRSDPFELVLEADSASAGCAFDLKISGSGGVRVERDRRGMAISAGTGSSLTFTNLDAPTRTLTTTSNGAVTRTTANADDTETVELLGHNVLILFGSDVPAGPSTVLYTGKVVYTVLADDSFVLRSTSGTSTDICGAL